MSDFNGMFDTPSAAGAAPSVSPNWAIAAGVFGELTRAYANFAAVRNATYEQRSQASAFGHRARMLQLDRLAAERQAEAALEQGASEIGNLSLEGEQRRAELEAGTAASGVDSSVGSSADVRRSEQLVEDIERYHINLAAVRAANSARAGAVGAQNQALFARTSARNLRRSARNAMPEAQLIGGVGSAAVDALMLSQYRRA